MSINNQIDQSAEDYRNQLIKTLLATANDPYRTWKLRDLIIEYILLDLGANPKQLENADKIVENLWFKRDRVKRILCINKPLDNDDCLITIDNRDPSVFMFRYYNPVIDNYEIIKIDLNGPKSNNVEKIYKIMNIVTFYKKELLLKIDEKIADLIKLITSISKICDKLGVPPYLLIHLSSEADPSIIVIDNKHIIFYDYDKASVDRVNIQTLLDILVKIDSAILSLYDVPRGLAKIIEASTEYKHVSQLLEEITDKQTPKEVYANLLYGLTKEASYDILSFASLTKDDIESYIDKIHPNLVKTVNYKLKGFALTIGDDTAFIDESTSINDVLNQLKKAKLSDNGKINVRIILDINGKTLSFDLIDFFLISRISYDINMRQLVKPLYRLTRKLYSIMNNEGEAYLLLNSILPRIVIYCDKDPENKYYLIPKSSSLLNTLVAVL